MSRPRGRPPHPDVLTPAEWRVLDLVRHGLDRRGVAARLGIGVDAVKYHIGNIGDKIGVRGMRRLRRWPGYPAQGGLARSRTARNEESMQGRGSIQLGRIAQVSLSIRDVARAEAFYGTVLGLPHLFTFGDLAFFDADGVRLYLHRKDDDAWRPGSVLYFLVDDIHAAQAELADRGARFTGAPHLIYTDEATGVEEWMAFFEDGEGNTLAITSRVAPRS